MTMRPLPMSGFALITLAPAGLLVAGVMVPGVGLPLALIYMTGLGVMLDQLVPLVSGDAPEGAEFPAADVLLVVLAALHLVLLPLAVWAVAGDSGLPLWQRVVGFAGFGLWFGQVSNPCAHELIHRGSRGLFWLGAGIYTSLLFGHHASAHRLVHHRHAASLADPSTARAGEGFYRFAGRAWWGSFKAGLRAEQALRAGRRVTPYSAYLTGAAGALGLGYVLAGWAGVLVWLGLATHAQVQLLLSDYVQHYGLQRRRLASGKLEPVGPQHSWNAPHWFTSALMLNAPRHSDHHAHPSRPYPALRLPGAGDAPRLPWPLPVCCTVALVPPVWRRMMAPLVEQWLAKA